MNTEKMIEVTGCDLRVLVKKAYELSVPLGMGHLHYKAGVLDDATVDKILASANIYSEIRLVMDYVHGRAVKLSVFRQQSNGESPTWEYLNAKGPELWWIYDQWPDHSAEQLDQLLSAIGKAQPINFSKGNAMHDDQEQTQEQTEQQTVAVQEPFPDPGPVIEGFYDTVAGRHVVLCDGTPMDIEESRKIRNHSNEFNWGYGGSGPAQLALAILLKIGGDADLANRHYQIFKWDVIQVLPHGPFRLPIADVRQWIKNKT